MSRRPVIIAPSVLSADFARLGEQAVAAAAAGADWLHLDVMDGRYVPPITFGAQVVAALRPLVTLPLDVHLMVVEPERHIAGFAQAGAGSISVHVEATVHLHRTLEGIRELQVRPGVAINPTTPLAAIEEALPYVDFVNVLSVNPGYGGQRFIPGSLDKIARLRAVIDARKLPVLIEVDGGANPETMGAIVAAGADVVVAGSAVFNAQTSVATNLARLRTAAVG